MDDQYDQTSLDERTPFHRMVSKAHDNAQTIQLELDWLQQILKARSAINANPGSGSAELLQIPAPDLSGYDSTYADLVRELHLGPAERFLIILAAVPHIRPQLLDMFMSRNQITQQIYTEFGGRKGKSHNGFIPTGETVLFILAGNDLKKRFLYQNLLDANGILFKENILRLSEVETDESFLNGALIISREVLDQITIGKVQKPPFSSEFPAQRLQTPLDWEDLVLPEETWIHLRELEVWLKHKDFLMKEWGMSRILKPGYKALFFGPPGTGKTLTAALLGKKMNLDVYRIDLSRLVSKYIGETEKNLSKVFDRAEKQGWILFFDEADALFGKRTSVSDAHDRYANQEVSYLLQRIEDYDGLVILATNLKNNLDDAFMRRFQASVFFPVPQAEERFLLWKKGFPEKAKLESKVDLASIAASHELSGGVIINVIQHSLLMALENEEKIVQLEDIREGIRREYQKVGRTI
ncbi:ATP-binding protein [Dyadobacter fanqingshengii]|uniref:ATP-binding protein n=1 Tax=Dyadobacter fanqingshengii TaxID=2906443 RepID=A0A9X1P880_9BACT|nr:ATP-binding protein [Dyadobacter fanqingshengii]MCF0039782.1 ATP-binding protein [Dyadobacter fanqingshengii]USJ38455.1 ATP-binding protein [Dyadobacter fanqingshengii]